MATTEFWCNDCGFSDYNCKNYDECPKCNSTHTSFEWDEAFDHYDYEEKQGE